MIDIIKAFLDKYNIKNKQAVIAFSAGPDSCALARLLIEVKEEYNLDIILAYFNHMWRKEAIKEENFTQDFAKEFNIKYEISKAPEGIQCSEETARDLRYEFLYNTAQKYKTDVVFLAHNKNDNIETLIYRLIKGTSVKGLSSIPEKREIYYRPMLKIEKKQILDYLAEIKQNYMIDKSNSDTKYKRNYIRNEILPLFKEVNPNFLNNIDNLITTSIYTSKILDEVIQKALNEICENSTIKRSSYLNYNVEYRYEILNSFLGSRLKYRDFKTIKKLDDFILNNPHSKTSLNKCEFLRTRKDKIFIEKG
ncbi:MAG: tRNA lysidine(34) synthetase TilS [Candidatus Gastranaerophilales bacterium]|nr:tRNA lysidine(34) synthetase TilS [Candidatus Gastranaerophilales bacterium]